MLLQYSNTQYANIHLKAGPLLKATCQDSADLVIFFSSWEAKVKVKLRGGVAKVEIPPMSQKAMAQNEALAPLGTRWYWATIRVQFFPYGWHSSPYSFRSSLPGFLVSMSHRIRTGSSHKGRATEKELLSASCHCYPCWEWEMGTFLPYSMGVFRKNKTSCLKQNSPNIYFPS